MTNLWTNRVVLVVEDEPINFLYLFELLSESGLILINAKSGEEAIEICQTNNKIELVLMDIQLPGISGYEATKKIKTIKKDLPIIAQTAYSQSEEKEKAIKASCDGYISKPIDTDELYAIFNKYLNK
ncbi:MAG TPA: response regulator [Bacteroidales bacterium]|nr:response regulator [Bacteroidales bacterium]